MVILLSVVAGVVDPVAILLQASFFNAIDLVLIEGRESTAALIVPAFFLLLSFLLPSVNELGSYFKAKMEQDLSICWQEKMSEIVRGIPYQSYEDQETFNRLSQVKSNNLVGAYLCFGLSMITAVTNIIMYFMILIRISWILVLSVLFFSPFVGYASTKLAKTQLEKNYQTIPDRRIALYKSGILRKREYAKEIRLNRAGKYLLADWLDKQKSIDTEVLKIKMKYGFLSALIEKSNFIVIAINLAITLVVFMQGKISTGFFISISNKILTLNVLKSIQGVFAQKGKIKANKKIYLELLGLMKHEPAPEGGQVRKTGRNVLQDMQGVQKTEGKEVPQVEFVNVSFQYPNAQDYAVRNVSFSLRSGESLVIVGENGSGKSTLIKLLLGLYVPTEGRILINGRDAAELGLEERAEIFSVAFQDFAKFSLSIKDNICLKNEIDSSMCESVFELLQINEIASDFKNGQDTLVGKEFGNSVDISGGQWQRIALARAMVKKSSIVICDEPTAALDPVNEARMFEKIVAWKGNHTLILITHRLGFTSRLDTVLMMKDGTICEKGSFGELIARRGEFFHFYKTQQCLYMGGGKDE